MFQAAPDSVSNRFGQLQTVVHTVSHISRQRFTQLQTVFQTVVDLGNHIFVTGSVYIFCTIENWKYWKPGWHIVKLKIEMFNIWILKIENWKISIIDLAGWNIENWKKKQYWSWQIENWKISIIDFASFNIELLLQYWSSSSHFFFSFFFSNFGFFEYMTQICGCRW